MSADPRDRLSDLPCYLVKAVADPDGAGIVFYFRVRNDPGAMGWFRCKCLGGPYADLVVEAVNKGTAGSMGDGEVRDGWLWRKILGDENHHWVDVQVFIKKVETGEVRLYHDQLIFEPQEGEEEPRLYIWKDGNFSCDCKRELFFERAVGRERDHDTLRCGDSRFLVRIVNPVDGSIVYDEFEEE